MKELNGDRIRAMTDEELAEFFCRISQCCGNDASCSMCPIFDGCAQMKRVCEKECGPHFDYSRRLCDLDDDSTDTRCVFRDYVRSEPTIDAAPVRHGRWNYRHEDDWCYCTACGTDAEGSDGECLETNYCPHCCAKMDEKLTLGSEANGCWISCAECANTGCKNRYVQEAKEDDER